MYLSSIRSLLLRKRLINNDEGSQKKGEYTAFKRNKSNMDIIKMD